MGIEKQGDAHGMTPRREQVALIIAILCLLSGLLLSTRPRLGIFASSQIAFHYGTSPQSAQSPRLTARSLTVLRPTSPLVNLAVCSVDPVLSSFHHYSFLSSRPKFGSFVTPNKRMPAVVISNPSHRAISSHSLRSNLWYYYYSGACTLFFTPFFLFSFDYFLPF